ncbi:hypothetical protein ACJX0J_018851, partial [Zea mays]
MARSSFLIALHLLHLTLELVILCLVYIGSKKDGLKTLLMVYKSTTFGSWKDEGLVEDLYRTFITATTWINFTLEEYKKEFLPLFFLLIHLRMPNIRSSIIGKQYLPPRQNNVPRHQHDYFSNSTFVYRVMLNIHIT